MTKLADRGSEQINFDGNGQAMCAMTDAEVAEAADAMRRTAGSFQAMARAFAEAGFTRFGYFTIADNGDLIQDADIATSAAHEDSSTYPLYDVCGRLISEVRGR